MGTVPYSDNVPIDPRQEYDTIIKVYQYRKLLLSSCGRAYYISEVIKMSDNKVYKKSIIVESPLLDEEVREQVKDQAREALDESVACA